MPGDEIWRLRHQYFNILDNWFLKFGLSLFPLNGHKPPIRVVNTVPDPRVTLPEWRVTGSIWGNASASSLSGYKPSNALLLGPEHLSSVLQLPPGLRTGNGRTRRRLVPEQQGRLERPSRESAEILFLGVRLRQNAGGNGLARSADKLFENGGFFIPPEHGQELLLELASPAGKSLGTALEPVRERRRERRVEEDDHGQRRAPQRLWRRARASSSRCRIGRAPSRGRRTP